MLCFRQACGFLELSTVQITAALELRLPLHAGVKLGLSH
jgi:hypothetical protein